MEYFTQNQETISGILTVLISIVGASIAFYHVIFYNRSGGDLAGKMKAVFATDGLIYLITLAFGLWAFFYWSHDIAYAMHWVRHPILIANIWASLRLYKHYKDAK